MNQPQNGSSFGNDENEAGRVSHNLLEDWTLRATTEREMIINNANYRENKKMRDMALAYLNDMWDIKLF